MSELTKQIERQVERLAGVPVVVEEEAGRLVVSGLVASEEEKQAMQIEVPGVQIGLHMVVKAGGVIFDQPGRV